MIFESVVFPINLHLEYYDDDILSNIIRRSASILDVPCSLRAAGTDFLL